MRRSQVKLIILGQCFTLRQRSCWNWKQPGISLLYLTFKKVWSIIPSASFTEPQVKKTIYERRGGEFGWQVSRISAAERMVLRKKSAEAIRTSRQAGRRRVGWRAGKICCGFHLLTSFFRPYFLPPSFRPLFKSLGSQKQPIQNIRLKAYQPHSPHIPRDISGFRGELLLWPHFMGFVLLQNIREFTSERNKRSGV